jgi:hypothetical protein
MCQRTPRFEYGRTDTQPKLLVVWRDVKRLGIVFSMVYTVISDDAAGLAIGPASEEARDVHEALTKTRQMYETGFVNISIKDEAGHKIDGDECSLGIRVGPFSN